MKINFVLSIFGFILTLVQAHVTLASPVSIHSIEDLKQIKYHATATAISDAEDQQISLAMAKLGYTEITSAFRPLQKLFGISHVYATNDLSHGMMTRYGYEPNDHDLQGYVLKLNSQRFLVHSSTKKKTAFAAMFVGFNQVELNTVLNKIRGELPGLPKLDHSHSTTEMLLNMFLPQAQADEDLVKKCEAENTARLGSLQTLGAQAIQYVGFCVSKAWSGLYSSMIGDTLSLFNGEFWASATGMYDVIKKIWTDFSKEVAANYKGLEKNPKLIFEFFCETVGGLLGSVALTAATAGATSVASIHLRLLSAVEKIKTLMEKSKLVTDNAGRVSTIQSYTDSYVESQCGRLASTSQTKAPAQSKSLPSVSAPTNR
jgi:hypothetical protein